MSGNRRRAFLVAAILVGCTMTVTACEDPDSGAAKETSSSGSSVSSATDGGKSSGENGSEEDGAGGSPSGDKGEAGKCRTDELEITAKDVTDSSESHGTVAVELKNGGGRDCALAGYAGVDLKTSEGTLSAKRTGEQADSFVLEDGKSTFFGIDYPAGDSGGSGVRVTGLVVTPPDETKSVTLDWPGGGTLPVTDGSGSPVTVGKPGGIGQGG
jgi:predicted small secreted protein